MRCQSTGCSTCYVSEWIKTSSSYSFIYAKMREELMFARLIYLAPTPANTPCILMHLSQRIDISIFFCSSMCSCKWCVESEDAMLSSLSKATFSFQCVERIGTLALSSKSPILIARVQCSASSYKDMSISMTNKISLLFMTHSYSTYSFSLSLQYDFAGKRY